MWNWKPALIVKPLLLPIESDYTRKNLDNFDSFKRPSLPIADVDGIAFAATVSTKLYR